VSELIRSRRAWLGARPVVADALVSAFLTVSCLVEAAFQNSYGDLPGKHPDVLCAVLMSVVVMSLTLRRRMPVPVMAFTLAGNVLLTVLGYVPTLGAGLACLVALYSVASHRGLGTSLPVGVLALVTYLITMAAQGTRSGRR
jgi:hypothetical protein